MSIRRDYFNSIRNHRKNIRKACDYWFCEWTEIEKTKYKDIKEKDKLKKELNKIKIKHDLSKFFKSEFKPCMNWLYGPFGAYYEPVSDYYDYGYSFNLKNRYLYKKAMFHHYEKNKYNWQHWLCNWKEYKNGKNDIELCLLPKPKTMTTNAIIELICEWTANAYEYGGTAQKYYLYNYNNIILARSTRIELENKLGLKIYKPHTDIINNMTIKELLESGYRLNEILKPTCKRYSINFNDFEILDN